MSFFFLLISGIQREYHTISKIHKPHKGGKKKKGTNLKGRKKVQSKKND